MVILCVVIFRCEDVMYVGVVLLIQFVVTLVHVIYVSVLNHLLDPMHLMHHN